MQALFCREFAFLCPLKAVLFYIFMMKNAKTCVSNCAVHYNTLKLRKSNCVFSIDFDCSVYSCGLGLNVTFFSKI